MKPYLEHIAASKEGSWTLFDRRLPAIPFEWHYNSEYELTLTLNSRGQRFVGDNMAAYDDGDLVLIGPKIPHTWCSSEDCDAGITHQALVLWFSEAFVQSLIKPHVELRPIQVLLESSTRAVQFSDAVKAKARIIICDMWVTATSPTSTVNSKRRRGRLQENSEPPLVREPSKTKANNAVDVSPFEARLVVTGRCAH